MRVDVGEALAVPVEVAVRLKVGVGVTVAVSPGVEVGTAVQPLFTPTQKELLTKGTPPVLSSSPASTAARYQVLWMNPRARASLKKSKRFKLVTEVTLEVIW